MPSMDWFCGFLLKYITILRVTAYELRFIHNICKRMNNNQKDHKFKFVTTDELNLARKCLVWLSQHQTFDV